MTPAELQASNARLPGLVQDSQRGEIAVAVVDCSWGYAQRVQVTTDLGDAGIAEVYGTNADPTLTATDLSGLAFLVNVPASTGVRLTATPLGTDRPSSVAEVQVRAGWITGIVMNPTP